MSSSGVNPNRLHVRKKPKPGIYLEPQLLDSPAFNELNRTELRVLIHFYRKRQFPSKKGRKKRSHEILNNGQIVFTYREAAETLGVSKSAFTRALDGLSEHGFIDIGLTGAGLYRSATKYGISTRWKRWGTPQFVELQRRRPTRTLRGFAARRT